MRHTNTQLRHGADNARWTQHTQKKMDRIPVSSTNLMSIGYDESTSVLEVKFQRTGVYQYFGVPADAYEQLMAAPSKGAYFNEAIKKGGYACARVG